MRLFSALARWPEQNGHRRELLRAETVIRHSWPCSHRHHTLALDQGKTSLAVRAPLRIGCHSAASRGSTAARQVSDVAASGPRCAQYGQPAPCTRPPIAARHSWPSAHRHQNRCDDPGVSVRRAPPELRVGCHCPASSSQFTGAVSSLITWPAAVTIERVSRTTPPWAGRREHTVPRPQRSPAQQAGFARDCTRRNTNPASSATRVRGSGTDPSRRPSHWPVLRRVAELGFRAVVAAVMPGAISGDSMG